MESTSQGPKLCAACLMWLLLAEGSGQLKKSAHNFIALTCCLVCAFSTPMLGRKALHRFCITHSTYLYSARLLIMSKQLHRRLHQCSGDGGDGAGGGDGTCPALLGMHYYGDHVVAAAAAGWIAACLQAVLAAAAAAAVHGYQMQFGCALRLEQGAAADYFVEHLGRTRLHPPVDCAPFYVHCCYDCCCCCC
eukprot:scaffold49949_cov24-Tisochrysis_lutea.AAC.1